MKTLFVLVGPSGSGKSTIAEELQRVYGWKIAESYTDRKPRYPGEKGHVFVSKEEFSQLGKLLLPAEFDGNRYGMTKDILDNSDLIILEPKGVFELRQTYKDKPIRVIGLQASRSTREKRMRHRGDTEVSISRRLYADNERFADLQYITDAFVDVDCPIETAINRVMAAVQYCENDVAAKDATRKQDERLEQLWEELADVPVDPETEKLESPFLFFPIGTDKEDIWHWFDERYSKGVAALLYGA